MSNATYFVQECPTCGRRLQIRVEYLGRKVVCQHCQGQLLAADASNAQLRLRRLAQRLASPRQRAVGNRLPSQASAPSLSALSEASLARRPSSVMRKHNV